ncbi:hypothetical protein [Burkholderia sp. LMG 21824]|uniref:hypothetical protein n=1 Tax=Burkholderia sp. LMG 21824 TaxID=3158172 RepID=UPI003C2AFDF3
MDGNTLKLMIFFILSIAFIVGGIGGLCNEHIKDMRGIPAMMFAPIMAIGPIVAIFSFASSLASSKISPRVKLAVLILFLITIVLLISGLKEYMTNACFVRKEWKILLMTSPVQTARVLGMPVCKG